MKRILLLAAAVAATIGCVAAKQPGSIRLNVEVKADKALAAAVPAMDKWQAGDKIEVNGAACEITSDKKDRAVIGTVKADNGLYTATWPADCVTAGEGNGTSIILAPAQQYREGGFDRICMPMHASKCDDRTLALSSLCGVLKLTVTGDADINSIRIEDNSGAALSGYFDIDPETGLLVGRNTAEGGVGFVVLDCSNGGKGVKTDSDGTTFHIVMPARKYADGVRISISDRSHRNMTVESTEAFTINRGEVKSLRKIAYKPAENQVFAENFDSFEWGGDRNNGKKAAGFRPAADGKSLDGSERAVTASAFDKAGTGYLQNDYKVLLAEKPAMGTAYLDNRNVHDWRKMFRVQEYPGYLGVGVHNNSRGIVETPMLESLDGVCDIEVTFKVALQAKANSCVMVAANKAGVVKEYWVDGIRHTLYNTNYPYVNGEGEYIKLTRNVMPPAGSDAAVKEWHTVRLVVAGATAETSLYWTSEFPDSDHVNGFFLDDIEVKLLNSVPRERILRVMDYNIQNGMWADQQNNYDNFVAFVNSVDADVCVFCEAQTIYYSGTHDKCKPEERYLTDNWGELAARFGHKYWAIGAHQDNYPVVITSKYPVTLVQALGGDEVSHGGLHAQVTVDGETINFVGFHTWPQAYSKDAKRDAASREKSKREHGGDKTREDEFRIFMERTILNPQYAGEKNWLIMGDMNCATPLDDSFHDLGWENPRYLGQKYMLDNVPAFDLVKIYNNPDKRDAITPSTQGWGRIDLMYGSEPMLKRLLKAKSPKWGFTKGTWNDKTKFYDGSSDHLPVIVDFIWR